MTNKPIKKVPIYEHFSKVYNLIKHGEVSKTRVAGKDGKTAVQVLFDEVAPKYATKNGGYTRVTKTGFRRGDAAPLATVELV